MRISETTLEINRIQKDKLIAKMMQELVSLDKKRIGVWGLSFKPNTDDIRESPAIALCKKLLEHNAQVQVYDPLSMMNAKRELNGDHITYCEDAYAAAAGADALLIATEWNEFRNVDLEKVKRVMGKARVFDSRNIFDPIKLVELGFSYFGMGR